MADVSDMALLQDYDRHGSEDAFATVIQRHINLVYSTAFRHVGIAAQAEEITQVVFVILAHKAARLHPDTILEGWLYETTRLTALRFRRGERRRQFREHEAYMQSTLPESDDTSTWNQLAPLLDEALSRLGKKDRDAVILRFFKDQSMREIAAALSLNEEAAQKRVRRAVEKLRLFFAKRGIAHPAEVLTVTISTHSVQAAPAALAKAVTTIAMAKGATAGGSTLTLIKGALKVMAWTKTKTTVVVGLGVLLAVATTTVIIQKIRAYETYLDSWRVPELKWNMVAKAAPQVSILPSKFKSPVYALWGDYHKWGGVRVSVIDMVWAAYHWHPGRILFPAGQPTERYDFISTLPQSSDLALQREIKNKLGLVGRRETRDMDVLVLKVRTPNAAGLQPPVEGKRRDWWGLDVKTHSFHYDCDDQPLSTDPLLPAKGLTKFLEQYFAMPVIDDTGLTDHFHIHLTWQARGKSDLNRDAVKQALLDQLGLELVPDRQPVEMLVVEQKH
jgi:uncharacterized protein (TIGR03435 family)